MRMKCRRNISRSCSLRFVPHLLRSKKVKTETKPKSLNTCKHGFFTVSRSIKRLVMIDIVPNVPMSLCPLGHFAMHFSFSTFTVYLYYFLCWTSLFCTRICVMSVCLRRACVGCMLCSVLCYAVLCDVCTSRTFQFFVVFFLCDFARLVTIVCFDFMVG